MIGGDDDWADPRVARGFCEDLEEHDGGSVHEIGSGRVCFETLRDGVDEIHGGGFRGNCEEEGFPFVTFDRDHFDDDVVLGWEVAVESAWAHGGFLADFLHGGGVEAFAAEAAGGGVEDAASAGVVVVGSGAFGFHKRERMFVFIIDGKRESVLG